MAKHRTHSIEFKRQIAQDFIAGETLHALASRHDISRNCMITANRRASATIAFFIPRRLAICIAQALSQDHFLERIML